MAMSVQIKVIRSFRKFYQIHCWQASELRAQVMKAHIDCESGCPKKLTSSATSLVSVDCGVDVLTLCVCVCGLVTVVAHDW